MTRVFPLPAPARISTGPSVVSTASRCCGFSSSRNDKREWLPLHWLLEFYTLQNRRIVRSIRLWVKEFCAHLQKPGGLAIAHVCGHREGDCRSNTIEG